MIKTYRLPYYLKQASDQRLKDELNASKIVLRCWPWVLYIPKTQEYENGKTQLKQTKENS